MTDKSALEKALVTFPGSITSIGIYPKAAPSLIKCTRIRMFRIISLTGMIGQLYTPTVVMETLTLLWMTHQRCRQ